MKKRILLSICILAGVLLVASIWVLNVRPTAMQGDRNHFSADDAKRLDVPFRSLPSRTDFKTPPSTSVERQEKHPTAADATPHEKERIQAKIKQISPRLREIEKANTTVLSVTASASTFLVRAPGKEQMSRIQAALTELIGEFAESPAADAAARREAVQLLNEYTYYPEPIKLIEILGLQNDSQSSEIGLGVAFLSDENQIKIDNGGMVSFTSLTMVVGYDASKDPSTRDRYGYLMGLDRSPELPPENLQLR